MATVVLDHVSSVFSGTNRDRFHAAEDLNLEIDDGEWMVVAGPSGSGKSTLLRMIAGLDEISGGEIRFGERRVNDLAPRDRDVAMVFGIGGLYPRMTVDENMAFGLQRRNYARAEIKKRIADAAKILGIENLLDRHPNALSAEQRQRVTIGRAVVRQPKVLLFDEPLAELDPDARARIRSEIKRLHQRLQSTTIYATRDPIEAMTMGDRIVVMNNGHVEQLGRLRELYDRPANLFVAGFLGNPPMNLIHGTLNQERDAIVFRESGDGTVTTRIAPTNAVALGGYVGKPVVLGIRADALEIAASTKPGRIDTHFAAILELVEPTGSEAYLHLHTGAHQIICRGNLVAEEHQPGDRLQVEFNPAKACFFDPETTNRLV